MARSAKPAPANAKTKSPIRRRERNREGSGSGELQKRLAEALAQHAAIGEILNVMSASPSDVRPVLDAVAERAARLCEAPLARVLLVDGDKVRPIAEYSLDGTSHARTVPIPLKRTSIVGRAVLDRAIIHHDDVVPLLETEYPDALNARRLGLRAVLVVPLVRGDKSFGVILLWRREPGLFSHDQVALLQTFAEQAAIAINSVRLFNETKEALERQTATSEILRVISQSPTDVQPVFDTIAGAALKLCRASSANVFTFDGQLLHLAALAIVNPEAQGAMRKLFPRPAGRDTAAGRAVLTRSVVAIPDVLEDPDFAHQAVALPSNMRSLLDVPLMREGSPIGAIAVGRPEPGPFPETQIALLQTFADQAAIAIENVRLFTELTHKNRALTQAHARVSETLERQTATSEVLRVISSSPTDVQPVFETIVASAARLCGAESAVVYRFDSETVHFAAGHNFSAEALEVARRRFPRPLRETDHLRRVLDGSVLNMPDIEKDPHTTSGSGDVHRAHSVHGTVVVPMVREGRVIGAIGVSRREVGSFANERVELLKTFADQAVIAIENVRLFTELEGRNRDLTATSEILRVISISPTNVQPVFDAIVKNAVHLCEARYGAVFRLDRGLVHLAAHHNISETLLAEWFHTGPVSYPMAPNRGHASGRAILAGAAVQVPDILADKEYLGGGMKAAGFRSLLGVPLLHRGQALGAIVIYRTEPGQFADKHADLLKTFADQAVIAIENVRLFTELETRTTQLTKSVGELKALGEVGRAVSSTLDLDTVLSTIVSRAAQLAGMDGGSIWEYDEGREEFCVRATDRLPDELVEAQRATPIRKGEGALGRLAMTGEPVEISNIATEPGYPAHLREILVRSGYRSVLAVPLLREDHLLGALAVNRSTPGEFASEVTALLKTFATQSALAIQNARLYREIEVKSREVEAASRHKSEFLANMSHELRTPLNAIMGFSEVLSERMFGDINEKQAEYIGDIRESGQHLLSLINDILDLSKIEAGRMELELSDFDLPSAMENTLILVRERAQRLGITLGCAIDERLGTVHADERKVKQVLLNLLSNALKFTPEGGKISVSAAFQDSLAEISVRDTGVGIAPEDQEALFEEFRQVGTASKKVEGTGLGLAISRKFIELHGGKIWITSQVGTGSTFTFTLPL
jgi:GAF domain-containing protein